MSGNLTDLMTPEQARMMYAALRERLPQGADQPIDVTAPLEFLSVSARQPNAPVTQGIAATAQASADAAQPAAASAPAATTAAPAAQATASPTVPQGEADALARLRELVGSREGRPSEGELARDALSNFFFSMAASRNPSFFGQLGEAGQTFSAAARQARQDARQERQVDVEAAYRAASEARQAAEADWARDQRNPLNIARLAAARSDEIRARAALASAGRERLGQGYVTRNPETGAYQIEYPAAPGGPQSRPFSGVPATVAATTRRAEQADISMIERAGQAADRNYRQSIQNSGRIVPSADVEQGAAEAAHNARREAAARLGVDPSIVERFGGTAAQTGGGPAIVIDPSNRPVR